LEVEKVQKSHHIYCKVIELDEWKKADCIGITISQKFEVETRELIKKAWKEGKKVAVPKCIPDTRQMEFYIITSFQQLEVVYFHLLEPIVEQTEKISP